MSGRTCRSICTLSMDTMFQYKPICKRSTGRKYLLFTVYKYTQYTLIVDSVVQVYTTQYTLRINRSR